MEAAISGAELFAAAYHRGESVGGGVVRRVGRSEDEVVACGSEEASGARAADEPTWIDSCVHEALTRAGAA